jgi:hypothetical protein
MARFTMNQLLSVITGSAFGLGIWTGSPYATGQAEAWGAGRYYSPILTGIALIGGFTFPRADGLFLASLYVGQLVGLFAGGEPWRVMVVGIFALAICNVPAILGVAVGAFVARRMTNRRL